MSTRLSPPMTRFHTQGRSRSATPASANVAQLAMLKRKLCAASGAAAACTTGIRPTKPDSAAS